MEPLSRALGLVALASLAVPAPPPVHAQAPRADGEGRDAAVDLWLGWVAERLLAGESPAYVPEDAAKGRLVLVRSSRRSPGKAKKAIERTCAAFDELLPPPEKPADGARVPVLLDLEDGPSLGSATGFLGKEFPYLAGWARSAGEGVGFVLEDPPTAAWVESVPGLEKEWNPENELVNRLSQLLLLARGGRMPQWLSLGLAWCIELDVCKDIYCFPHRAGFVGKREHKGWAKQLGLMREARGEKPFSIDDIAGWARGTYDDERAAVAWGAATLLARTYGSHLPAVVDELARVRERDGRVTHPDGSWEAVPGYEIPPETQREVLDRVLGFDFFAELARFAAEGPAYVRRRP